MIENRNAATNNTLQSTNQQSNLAHDIYSWLLVVFTVLLPLLVLPITSNFIGQTKLLLIFIMLISTAGLFLFNSFKEQSWKVVISPLTLPLFIFAMAVLGSTFLTQNYPVKNLVGMGGAYLGFALLPLLGGALANKKLSRMMVPTVAIAGALLSLSSLLQMVGYGPTQLINAVTGFELPSSLLFNLSGSSLIATEFIALATLGVIIKIIKSKKITTLDTLTLPVLVLGLGLHIWSMLPGQVAEMVLAPFSASWSVALDSLRAPRSALIGQGPEAYVNTFARFRPDWLNSDRYWQVNFGAGRGLPLTMLVQLGFIGLISWLMIAVKFFVNKNEEVRFKDSPISWMLGAAFLLQLIFPPSYVLLGLQAILIVAWIAEFKDEFSVLKLRALNAQVDGGRRQTQSFTKANRWITLITNGILAMCLVLVTYLLGRTWLSFYRIYQANQAYLENDGVAVYNAQRQAVFLNPYLDSHRRSYALTNLQLATALSNKTDITEQEQQQVSQLIQQAVTEANSATQIDPQDYRNWSVLAQIYQELISSAEEADQWAVNAYVQAIQNSPSNPLLRIQLGNILFNQEKVQQAVNLYQQAVNLKPDFAAGYYHLGKALRAGKQLDTAKQSWQQALQLLDRESEDYQQLQQLMATLEEEIEQASAAAQAQGLTDPTQAGSAQAVTESGQTPLGRELPDITSQNLQQAAEGSVSQPESEPLELNKEDAQLLNEEENPEQQPITDDTTEETQEEETN